MIICIDFDGTVVRDDNAYDDLSTELAPLPHAVEGLHALRRAGHTLVLYSARANPCLWGDWRLNEMWVEASKAGPGFFDVARWRRQQKINRARYQQMLDFVDRRLPGVFDHVWQSAGKPVGAALFIDDRAMLGGETIDWRYIAERWGEVVEHAEDEQEEQAADAPAP
jgi:hypothetical protein